MNSNSIYFPRYHWECSGISQWLSYQPDPTPETHRASTDAMLWNVGDGLFCNYTHCSTFDWSDYLLSFCMIDDDGGGGSAVGIWRNGFYNDCKFPFESDSGWCLRQSSWHLSTVCSCCLWSWEHRIQCSGYIIHNNNNRSLCNLLMLQAFSEYGLRDYCWTWPTTIGRWCLVCLQWSRQLDPFFGWWWVELMWLSNNIIMNKYISIEVDS